MPTRPCRRSTAAATLIDTFNVVTADGTAQLVPVTIHAQNDAATVTGDAAGSVTEVRRRRQRRPRRHRPRQHRRCLAGGRGRRRDGERLRQLRALGVRRVDLHARQRQRGRAGAQRRGHADRHLHGADRGRHRANRDRHDPRRRTMPRSSPAMRRARSPRPAASTTPRPGRRPRPAISTRPTSTMRTMPGPWWRPARRASAASAPIR